MEETANQIAWLDQSRQKNSYHQALKAKGSNPQILTKSRIASRKST